MNFQSMEYFVILAQERNFTRAAKQLHITQQSLSAHIAAVEKELGCQLLIRRTPLELTYAGRTFLRYAKNYQNSMWTMQKEFNDIKNNKNGELRIGSGYTHSYILLPPVIAEFQKAYPDVRIIINEEDEPSLIGHLMDGSRDLIIRHFTDSLPDVHYEEFYEEEVVLLATSKLLESLGIDADRAAGQIAEGDLTPLRACPFILNEASGISAQTGMELFRRSGFFPLIKVTSGNINTLFSLCNRNVGAGFAPKNMVHAMLTGEQRACLKMFHLPKNFRYPIRFAYLDHAYQWSMIAEFIRVAREVYPMMAGQE